MSERFYRIRRKSDGAFKEACCGTFSHRGKAYTTLPRARAALNHRGIRKADEYEVVEYEVREVGVVK